MNSKTTLKIIIGIVIFLFFCINGYIIANLITNQAQITKEAQNFQITEYLAGATTSSKTVDKNLITSTNNFSLESENIKIYALADSSFKLTSSSITIEKGTAFIKTENFDVIVNNQKISLANSFSAIIDGEDGVILAEGDAAFNNQILDLNTQLLPIASSIEVYEFDKSSFAKTDKYINLTELLISLNLLPEYLNDTTPPELISISPRDGFTTQERFVRMFGYTELGSKVIINNSETIDVDDEGYFTQQVDLKVGDNFLDIILKDRFGNTKSININYERKEVEIPKTVTSYPVSAPVSYTN